MKKLSIAIIILCLSSSILSAQSDFPASWSGHWKGKVHMFQKGTDTAFLEVQMQLSILPAEDSSWTWSIIYGFDEKDKRDYLLKPKDRSKGIWVIDERDGIILDQQMIAGRLTGAFSVGTSLIINNYQVEKGIMLVEFTTIGQNPAFTTGKETEESPTVKNYEVKGYQKGVLEKVR